MKIEPGADAPAQVALDDGTVIFEGTYTACGRFMDERGGKLQELINENYNLKRQVEALEQLRPLWAQGYTSDGQAAQATGNALTQLWEMLGADNQTAAVAQLNKLKSAPPAPIPDGVYFYAEYNHFYDYKGCGMGVDFYEEWKSRAKEFPQRDEVRRLDKASPHSGPSVSCDARPTVAVIPPTTGGPVKK